LGKINILFGTLKELHGFAKSVFLVCHHFTSEHLQEQVRCQTTEKYELDSVSHLGRLSGLPFLQIVRHSRACELLSSNLSRLTKPVINHRDKQGPFGQSYGTRFA